MENAGGESHEGPSEGTPRRPLWTNSHTPALSPFSLPLHPRSPLCILQHPPTESPPSAHSPRGPSQDRQLQPCTGPLCLEPPCRPSLPERLPPEPPSLCPVHAVCLCALVAGTRVCQLARHSLGSHTQMSPVSSSALPCLARVSCLPGGPACKALSLSPRRRALSALTPSQGGQQAQTEHPGKPLPGRADQLRGSGWAQRG